MVLKEQMTAVLSQNAVLKRAVAIQHERQKEFDERSHEVQGLKQLVLQYQEQLRTLEVTDSPSSSRLAPSFRRTILCILFYLTYELKNLLCVADQQLRAADASEAGPAEQLHARALQPGCLLAWLQADDDEPWPLGTETSGTMPYDEDD